MTHDTDPKPISKEWNYHPDLPLVDLSIFKWPPDPHFLGRWVLRNWLMLSERVMMVVLATLCWLFLYPSLGTAKTLAFGWVFLVWLVNLGLMICIAGGLHWFFYIRRGQGKALKFDHREPAKGNSLWNFSNQVHDNMFWSLGSGVLQVTALQVLIMWLMANGYFPTMNLTSNPILFIAGLMLLPIWSAFNFYWIHRLLHVPFLYKRVHALHHRNVNIGPWSGLSMHPVEHVLSVTLRQLRFTKEVYRKLMRNMRTDAIVNQWSTTRTSTAPLVPPLLDHTRYFRHAPACLCVVANMCGFACGCVAVCVLRLLWFV
jgi:hypothetical protein